MCRYEQNINCTLQIDVLVQKYYIKQKLHGHCTVGFILQ